MHEVNRCVVILKAKQPFLDWLLKLPEPVPADMTLQEIHDDHTALLIPDFEDNDTARRFIYKNYALLFEQELESWWTDEKDWPKKRTLAVFKEWFDVEVYSFVLDFDGKHSLQHLAEY
ncbi:MAG: hypothetical protein PHP45_01225 [Elusimicrobiales bacterium]|nr:hypothetical protein [Elusimicrobiales bacterium]